MVFSYQDRHHRSKMIVISQLAQEASKWQGDLREQAKKMPLKNIYIYLSKEDSIQSHGSRVLTLGEQTWVALFADCS